jgi:hypothetical protein
MNSDTQIKFDDGYTVTIKNAIVTMEHNGKKSQLHSSYFKPVPSGGKAEKFILGCGKKIEDYLFVDHCGQFILRATNGVREAVEAASLEYDSKP